MTDIELKIPIQAVADGGASLISGWQEVATPDNLDQINILIVDDEPRNLTVLETVLDDPGYRLVRAESAEQALMSLLSEEFALLILDINMPGTTGFQLAGLIKGRKKTAQIPIIFLTAYFNEEQHIIEGYDSGAVDYLHKPVNPTILRSKVAVLAELHRKQRELERANRALVAEIAERRHVQDQLRDLNDSLERRVFQRTEALRESAVLLKAVADNASVGLVIFDRDGRHKFANPAYCRFLGLHQSIIGRTPAECLPRAFGDQIGPRLQKALSGERTVFELALPSSEGDARTSCHYSVVCEPDTDAEGKVVAVVVVVIDITTHKRTEQHIQLLMNEVNHRSKNLLSVVMAVARQTAGATPQDFSNRFSSRLRSLAVNHDLLVKSQWKSIDLSELLAGQLAHLGGLEEQRVVMDGPRLQLTPFAAEALGMVIHELSTNAVKYGALNGAKGHVKIGWQVDPGKGKDRIFTLRWIENDGPAIHAPSREGLGTAIITRVTEMKLDGKTQLDYAPTGFSWSLTCPAVSVSLDEGQ